MYTYQEITCLDIELSSECNASCPQCPRNFFGYPNNRGYIEHSMTLDEAKKIFPTEFLSRLKRIYLNGNYGDLIMNPQTLEIIDYFRSHTPDNCRYLASTNAGARNRSFWTGMANLRVEVLFCLDGTDNETHGIYRRNTLYDTVINNAKSFIAAGGQARWKMIVFDHNRHQIDQARQLSKELGFLSFVTMDHKRNTGPIYDKNFNLVGQLGDWKPWNKHDAFEHMNARSFQVDIRDLNNEGYKPGISCRAKNDKDIYVSSTGRVSPCCFMGYDPDTYMRGSKTRLAYGNQQLLEIMDPNNALKYGIKNCINWFNKVEQSWTKERFEDGRLILCNDNCHAHNPHNDYSN